MAAQTFLDGKVTLYGGDCRDVIRSMPDASIDSVVTDPPYALVSIVKRYGKPGSAPNRVNTSLDGNSNGSSVFSRSTRGFMGKQWDTGETAFAAEFWAEVLRVLKPGGHVVAFSGTRTYHRMACAIEDAGFEIRDQIGYCFGSGFPKSHNVGKGLDGHGRRCSCGRSEEAVTIQSPADSSVRGMRQGKVDAAGVAEKGEPANMFASVQRSPSREGMGKTRSQRSSSEEDIHGDVWAEKSGMEGRRDLQASERELRLGEVRSLPGSPPLNGADRRLRDGASEGDGGMGGASADPDGMRSPSRPRSAEQLPDELGIMAGQSEPQVGGAWPVCDGCGKPIIPDGLGTSLKPAWEPICLARKPLIGTVAANVLAHGTGAINIDGCRINPGESIPGGGRSTFGNGGVYNDGRTQTNVTEPHDQGRWPANIIHDGSDEVVAAFPETTSGSPGDSIRNSKGFSGIGDSGLDKPIPLTGFGDSGSAARFFYTSKADAHDRIASKHPTVKPVDLMQYLVRLVTPKGGTVLDPFAGTGTTGEAAWREGMRAILIEREPEYLADIASRMDLAAKPTKRNAVVKAKGNPMGAEGTPLFSEAAE